jgi:hypothetical protein
MRSRGVIGLGQEFGLTAGIGLHAIERGMAVADANEGDPARVSGMTPVILSDTRVNFPGKTASCVERRLAFDRRCSNR